MKTFSNFLKENTDAIEITSYSYYEGDSRSSAYLGYEASTPYGKVSCEFDLTHPDADQFIIKIDGVKVDEILDHEELLMGSDIVPHISGGNPWWEDGDGDEFNIPGPDNIEDVDDKIKWFKENGERMVKAALEKWCTSQS